MVYFINYLYVCVVQFIYYLYVERSLVFYIYPFLDIFQLSVPQPIIFVYDREIQEIRKTMTVRWAR